MQRAFVAIGPAAAIVVIAVWEIVVAARAGADVPGAGDWERASEAVRVAHEPGDLIVFAPRWIDPVGRQHLGDLITLEMAGRMDADRYGTIWEVSIRGARAPETRGLEPSIELEVGEIMLRRFEREPVEVVADLVTLGRAAKASGATARPPSVVLAEVGFEPHRCMQVVPRPDGAVTLDYGEVTLGSSLVGHVGLADVFTRRDIRDPGRLEVRVDGEPVAEVTIGVDDGWVRFEAATAPGAHRVEVIATAVGLTARDRKICFAAEARR